MDKDTVTYLKAEKRVKEMKSFYRFLFTWIVLSSFFMALNLFSSPGDFWAIYPTLGIGLGVAIRYIRVFGWPGFGKEWEERKFYEEVERIKEREERIKYMLDHGRPSRSLPKVKDPNEAAPDIDKLELKEVKEIRKQWRDSEFV